MASTHSSKFNIPRGDIDLGYCSDHARSNEAFCQICRILICPNCLMFGSHQGHTVLDPTAASSSIRASILRSSKQGKLSPSFCSRFLLDIRDAKLKVQSNQAQVIEDIKKTFKRLINALKRRKDKLEDEVFHHYLEEVEKIDRAERYWIENKDLGRQVLEYSNNPDDETVLLNSLFIFNSIERLNEPAGMINVDLVNSVDLTSSISGKEVGVAELLRELEKVGKFSDEKNIQYRN